MRITSSSDATEGARACPLIAAC